MFVPLHDENTLKSIRFQFVTLALIVINVVGLPVRGIRPRRCRGRELRDRSQGALRHQPAADRDPCAFAVPVVPERLTLISYMFFHGDILHLAGNMLFLWVFGDNVEDAMGHVKFLVFYLACGVFAGLTHAWMVPNSESPLIGASGAVAGVIAAYLMLHPRVRVWVLALKAIPLRISAAFALGLWILIAGRHGPLAASSARWPGGPTSAG